MSDPRLYQRAFGAYPSHAQMEQFDAELAGETPDTSHDGHAEMVATWVAESIECEECHGDGCAACDDLGRIALCDTGHDDLAQEVADRERDEWEGLSG